MPPRKSSRALGLQRQDLQRSWRAIAGRPTRFDDERHEVRLVAVRLRLLVFVEGCRLAWEYGGEELIRWSALLVHVYGFLLQSSVVSNSIARYR